MSNVLPNSVINRGGLPRGKPDGDIVQALDGRTMEQAFPDIDPETDPLFNIVLIQLRSPKRQIGRLLLADESVDTETWNTTIGVVRAIGPIAFRNERTLEPWPGAEMIEVGTFVHVPLFHQYRFTRPIPGSKNELALFVGIRAKDLLFRERGNPLAFKAYV